MPLLVSSWKASNGAKTFTFNLKKNVHFANGDQLTSADVVFSLNRLINLKGNPPSCSTASSSSRRQVPRRHALEDAGRAAARDPRQPVDGHRQLEAPKQHGGTASVGADKKDKAESWLNSSASVGAGSGPYVLSAYSTTSQVTLKRNTKYWGATKPKFDTVVVRNMVAATQLINVSRGSHEVAIDLASDQAQSLKSNSRSRSRCSPRRGCSGCSRTTTRQISPVTSNKQWQNAIRFGLDYKSILGVAGPGAYQTPGIIPSMFAGALPAKEAIKQNVAKAKAALQASGQASQSVTLEYPSDLTINGVPFATLAQKVQSNLQVDRDQRAAVGLADRHVADELPQRQDGVRALAVGPGLPGSRRLPDVRPG